MHDPEPTERPRRRRTRRRTLLTGAAAGTSAVLAGLGVAELVAANGRSLRSPVLDVADRVVDGVPAAVKELAIDWFGTADKVALLVGIATILAAAAVVAGVAALGRRWWVAVLLVAAFALVGAAASQTTRRAAPPVAVVPSVVAGVVAGGALAGFRRLARRAQVEGGAPAGRPGAGGGPSIAELTPSERRRFLVAVGATAGGAALLGAGGRRWAGRFGAASSRAEVVLPPAARPLPPAPPGIAVPGAVPFFTPNGRFYRIDTALAVPQVPVDGWRLRVHGMVGRPRELTFAELLDRRLVESDITLTCVSNEVGGQLVGTARWLGVRLDELLDEVGVAPDADQVVGRSVDGYTCGFPVAALDGRDALVAVGMNGEPLPLAHGFPARLVVPGLYGYVLATKWLTEIELTRFDRFDQYWVARDWVAEAPIKVASRIDSPRGLATVAAGRVAVAGVAWAQTRGIEAVELRVDDGPWEPVELAEELNDTTWRQWRTTWRATPGRHELVVRAVERGGAIQPAERSEPFPSGATRHHQIVVIAR